LTKDLVHSLMPGMRASIDPELELTADPNNENHLTRG
jgi:hypothetical protein